jgi:hypothetical protein
LENGACTAAALSANALLQGISGKFLTWLVKDRILTLADGELIDMF